MAMKLILMIAALLLSPGVMAVNVIANTDVEQASVSRALLRGIFGMRVRLWPDGRPVRVYVLAEDASEHQSFCKSVLRIYPYQLRQAWDRLIFSGTGQPPNKVASLEEMLERIASTPGSIGYITQTRPGDGAALKVLNVR